MSTQKNTHWSDANTKARTNSTMYKYCTTYKNEPKQFSCMAESGFFFYFVVAFRTIQLKRICSKVPIHTGKIVNDFTVYSGSIFTMCISWANRETESRIEHQYNIMMFVLVCVCVCVPNVKTMDFNVFRRNRKRRNSRLYVYMCVIVGNR